VEQQMRNVSRREFGKKVSVGAGLVFLGPVFGMRAEATPPLRLIRTIPMPGFEGCDFDHFESDVKGNRLFLAAEDHKTVEVFNLRTGEHLRTVAGFEQPHAVVYLPDSNQLIVTVGGTGFGMCKLVSGTTYQVIGTMKLPPGADNAVFDPATQYCYVESRSPETDADHNLLNIIDTRTFKLIGEISLPGRVSQAMEIRHSDKRIFINLAATNEVGVIDLQTSQVIERWPVPEASVQDALALDEKNHRVFIACRKPPRFIAFNTDTGKVVANLPCVGVNDDMFYDAMHKRIYVTGDGTTSVFQQQDPDHYEHIAEVPTGFQGKTGLFVPELNRLYVELSGAAKPDEKLALMIFEARH
jgi:DNA-binding beta-propeller fold protein YncE